MIGFVLWSSFTVSAVECEVCVSFRGRTECRTVTAATEEDGIRGALDNACALVASGVTETMKCTRSIPTKAECRPLD